MKLSIIVMSFNSEKYVGKCLDHIFSQTGDHTYEVLIGDDHSTDNTLEILNKYKASYPDKIKIIANPENLKVMKNYHNLLQQCTGEYIAHCDSDDWWHDPEKCKKQIQMLDTHPEWAFIYTDCDIYNEVTGQTEKSLYQKSLEKYKNVYFDNSFTENRVLAVSLMFRRDDILKYIKFSEYIDYGIKCQDYPLTLELLKHKACGFLNESTATYRIHNISLSNHSENNKLIYLYEAYEVQEFIIKKYFQNSKYFYRKLFKFYYTYSVSSKGSKQYYHKLFKQISNNCGDDFVGCSYKLLPFFLKYLVIRKLLAIFRKIFRSIIKAFK